ncbi:unnamed protein product, partial [Hapterophycus canaliculatus]
TGWARAFFILNYIIGVAVMLNLVVTVVINSFWDEYKNTNKPALARRQLHAAAAVSARHRPAARRPSLYISANGGGGSCGGDGDGDGDGVAGTKAKAVTIHEILGTAKGSENFADRSGVDGVDDADGGKGRKGGGGG